MRFRICGSGFPIEHNSVRALVRENACLPFFIVNIFFVYHLFWFEPGSQCGIGGNAFSGEFGIYIWRGGGETKYTMDQLLKRVL